MRLEGKVAIVVGAGQTAGDTIGNGRATAILFAREGAQVLLVDRDEASANDTLKTIEEEGGAGQVFVGDITDESTCEALAKACVDAYGRIDILHNNVGIGTGDRGILDLTEETWETIFRVNLTGPFLTCKHVLPVMREQGSGAIINISSVAAIAATPALFAYKASKAGLNAITESLAIGNAKYGIRANAILPGLINTPMAIQGQVQRLGADKQELIDRRNKRVPLGKMGSAWDVAHAALFLASDEARFITGVLLPVDGGQSIKIG